MYAQREKGERGRAREGESGEKEGERVFMKTWNLRMSL
jgi:hypothetical protein